MNSRELALELVGIVDYDIAKSYNPDISELEPEEIENNIKELTDVIDKYNPLKILQDEHKIWSKKNFGKPNSSLSLIGILEELGELAHAHLKSKQGIRDTEEVLEKKAKDAVGDIVIFLASYCNARNFDIGQIVQNTWAEVKNRDYSKSGKLSKNKKKSKNKK